MNGLNTIGITDFSKIVSVNLMEQQLWWDVNLVWVLWWKKKILELCIHCVAHKLELGVLDAIRSIDYLHKFEDIVKSIYKFYARTLDDNIRSVFYARSTKETWSSSSLIRLFDIGLNEIIVSLCDTVDKWFVMSTACHIIILVVLCVCNWINKIKMKTPLLPFCR